MSEQDSGPNWTNRNSQNGKLKKRILVAVAVTVAGGIAWAKFSSNGRPDEAEALFTVRRGNLQVTVVESGKIEANKSVSLRSEVDGQCTIISIVSEGSYVKEGDVLVELDSSFQREEIDKREILVRSAEASCTNAEEAYEIQKNQNESDLKAAELTVEFAKIDLEKYVEGDWPQQLMKAQNAVITAETELQLAKERLDGTIALQEKGYVTDTQLKADRLAHTRAEISLDETKNADGLLKEYDHKKQLTQFQADYEEAQKELERAKRKTTSQLAQKEAELNATRATYRIEKARLDKRKDQLSKTTIRAPQPGLVIYASSIGDDHHGDRGLIAAGESVWERQRIIELPDVSTMKVKLHIHETIWGMVKPGEQAIITVEALPGLTLRGHVEKVAILPDSGHRWMDPDVTVYITYVLIDDKSEDLMPGMTAKAEVILADLKNVLLVPVRAVTVRREQEVCYVVKGSRRIETPVQVGLSNENYVEIKSGLNEGDKVLADAPIILSQGPGYK